MNLTRIPESTGIPAISRIACRLHCVPKKQGILSCSLKQGQGFDLSPGERNIVKNVTDQPIELSFNEAGINKIIVSENIPMYDLNILRIVIEQLHTGSDFKNIGDGTFSSIINSDIGRCNTVIEISRFSACTRNTTVNKRRYKLKLLRELHRTADETVIINKKPNLNNCRCYAQQYYRKYGDTVICEHGNITADLVNNFFLCYIIQICYSYARFPMKLIKYRKSPPLEYVTLLAKISLKIICYFIHLNFF